MRELWYTADVPQAIIDEDTTGGYPVRQTTPVYGSLTIPPCALNSIAPGFLASKAAKISVPVFIGYGDADVLAEPDHEPATYCGAASVEAARFAMMVHMHNFASTRQQLWDKLVAWMHELASERAEEATR